MALPAPRPRAAQERLIESLVTALIVRLVPRRDLPFFLSLLRILFPGLC